jgi:ligand-binding sensor domain-containing protein
MFLKIRNTCLKLYLTLFVIASFSDSILSQNYTIKTFTTENGLAHNNVRAIAEDSTGFLWIGTWDGLSRYDGYEFKNYYHIPGDSASIPYFSILNLVVDKANNLWILTDRCEIALYDRINDNFIKITDFGDKTPELTYNLSVDKNGDLWIVGNKVLLKRNIVTGKFIHFKIYNEKDEPLKIDSTYVLGLHFSDNNRMWISGPKIYELVNTSSDSVSEKLIIKNTYDFVGPSFGRGPDFDSFFRSSFYESPTGNIWIFSDVGLFRLDKDKGAFLEYIEGINKNEFKGNRLFNWGLNKGGLYSYEPATKVLSFIKPGISQFVGAILPHGKNMLWFSNSSKSGTPIGLKQVIFTDSFFKNYLIEKDGDELAAVFPIVKDKKNNIWAGVRGKDYFTMYTPDYEPHKIGQFGNEIIKLPDHIRSMIRVENGIWIGSFFDLLMFYDFKNGQFIRHFADEKSFRTIALDKNGNLFIGTQNLSLYYPESGKTEVLWKSSGENGIFYMLFLDNNGVLWGGKNLKMLLKYNIITKESTIYSISPENYHIEDICPGENGDLWLATLGEGICNFNPESGKTVFYTTSSGLSNNTTYSILKDRSGNLWLSTDDGICRFNTLTGQFRVFNRNDGLGIIEFNSRSSYIADNGEFFFGGMGGFVGFYPDSLAETEKKDVRQRILLTDFKVSGERKTLLIPLNNSDTIILNKGENNFQLSFSSTDFINSDKTLYRYKLDGVNKNWIETDSRNRNSNYSNLKPGKFLLEIQATNRNGDWTAEKKIIIITTPFFYQTLYFKISTPGFILSLVLGFIFLYIRQLKQRERQKQDALRLQSLRGQMNPHFIFNSLNSINYFISNNDKLSANKYIADFSRLIRSILSNLGNDYVPFEDELNSIKNYLNIEHLRFGDKFDYELKIDEINNNSDIEVFPGLVQPFIENAIWHGMRALEDRKGFIKVLFSYSGIRKIKCMIEDDGIGRHAALGRTTGNGNHKSRGIEIVTERLQLISKMNKINYDFSITDLNPDLKETGTRVEIEIPVRIS